MKSAWLSAAALGVTALIVTGCGSGQGGGTVLKSTGGPQGSGARWSSAPKMMIDKSKQYSALVHTNYGDFTIQLFAKDSPQTVNNFVFLAEHKFYNGDKFFRIIQNFMIQTGDPNNNGTGGPGYTIPDELPPSVPYSAGVVAMANSGQPNSGGSQFFICTVDDSQQLAPSYSELGKVVSGMDVITKIAAIPVKANAVMGGEMSSPTKDAHIESITVTEK